MQIKYLLFPERELCDVTVVMSSQQSRCHFFVTCGCNVQIVSLFLSQQTVVGLLIKLDENGCDGKNTIISYVIELYRELCVQHFLFPFQSDRFFLVIRFHNIVFAGDKMY